MRTPAAFEPAGKRPPIAGSWRLRFFAVRHAPAFARFYAMFERALVSLHPAFRAVGYERAERPVAFVEKAIKGALFDCRMCGQCILSSTGMSCPMNCPKGMRNGPCGGVRQDGHCEVNASMPCVWVQAWEGSRQMPEGVRIAEIQPPVDHRLKGLSSWLRIVREKRERPAATSAKPNTAAKH